MRSFQFWKWGRRPPTESSGELVELTPAPRNLARVGLGVTMPSRCPKTHRPAWQSATGTFPAKHPSSEPSSPPGPRCRAGSGRARAGGGGVAWGYADRPPASFVRERGVGSGERELSEGRRRLAQAPGPSPGAPVVALRGRETRPGHPTWVASPVLWPLWIERYTRGPPDMPGSGNAESDP